ncbi:hypothetical protein CCACVL1_18012 [Corchorus capsularis]|uniref:LRAT domain-containing protein n=1 Tax=Corchorus capsularis TaxID=210143 RepID=A0A1R3HNL2_COCAP|nr:hypothetical protein CCACVL1_18012 [Corchorus capsularis]
MKTWSREGLLRLSRKVKKLRSKKTVSRDELVPGDHIFSDRKSSLYYHHGIYVGNDKVIHHPGKKTTPDNTPCDKCGFKHEEEGIVITCLDCFLQGQSLHRYNYLSIWKYYKSSERGGGDPWLMFESKPADEVVKKAYDILQKQNFGKYNFLLNNCEDFAFSCKSQLGLKISLQVQTMNLMLAFIFFGGPIYPIGISGAYYFLVAKGTFLYVKYVSDRINEKYERFWSKKAKMPLLF